MVEEDGQGGVGGKDREGRMAGKIGRGGSIAEGGLWCCKVGVLKTRG